MDDDLAHPRPDFVAFDFHDGFSLAQRFRARQRVTS
jgi:hypothetical protein